MTNKPNHLIPTIQFEVAFDQIWSLIRQLSDEKQLELLNKLQAELEREKIIKPRMDEDQRRNYIPSPKPDSSEYNKPKVSKEDVIKWWNEENDDKEELDADLTDEELLKMIKNI